MEFASFEWHEKSITFSFPKRKKKNGGGKSGGSPLLGIIYIF